MVIVEVKYQIGWVLFIIRFYPLNVGLVVTYKFRSYTMIQSYEIGWLAYPRFYFLPFQRSKMLANTFEWYAIER